MVLVPLPPAVARAIDRAVDGRDTGPILRNTLGAGWTATPPANEHALRPRPQDADNLCCSPNSMCSLIGMTTRREHLLDAAIRVLGENGVRAVTHRAVDAEAGLASGSTANHFSTRESLFAGIVERFSQRERENFEEIAMTICPTSPADLGQALSGAVKDSVGRHRAITLSRYALLVESANNPGLRAHMAAAGGRVNIWVANWLRMAGSTNPEHDTHVLGNYVTGLVLHNLAMPDPGFDPTDKIISLLESLIPASTTKSPGRHGEAEQPDPIALTGEGRGPR